MKTMGLFQGRQNIVGSCLGTTKGNQSRKFIGRTDTEAEAPILWPRDAKSRLIGKDLMLGKIEGRRRRGWQRMRCLVGTIRFDGHEFEQTPGDSEGKRSLMCCSPQGCKELDTTERLNNSNCHRGLQTEMIKVGARVDFRLRYAPIFPPRCSCMNEGNTDMG